MDPLITAWLIAWVVIRTWEAVKAEWRHTRDRHATGLAREHADWSPGRIRRHARHRAWAHWWNEAGAGMPTWKAAWAENRLTARLALEKALTEGHKRIEGLRQAIADVQAERKAAGGEDPSPAGPGPGTGGKPALTVLPGGREPEPPEPPDGTTPEPPSPEPSPAPDGPAEPPEPEPSPEPELSGWLQPGDEICQACKGSGRIPIGENRYMNCPDCGGFGSPFPDETPPLPDGSTEEAPGVLPGAPPANEGEQVTAAADLETGDSPYDGMLAAIGSIAATARRSATTAGDDLRAAASVHGFSRDSATMAGIAEVEDALQAAAAAAERLRAGMTARHADGDEYHNGQDAHASAFRAT